MSESGQAWRTSSYSGSNGGVCVEVAARPGTVAVRDAKNRPGRVLRYSPAGWRAFTSQVKTGRFDQLLDHGPRL